MNELGAHGVGHGVAKLYDKELIASAVKVCSQIDDEQFQYACATGVYMDTGSPPDDFWPCDVNRYPAACYRFGSTFEVLSAQNITNICDTQCDDYHKVGCIYGHGYSLFEPSSHICEQYIPDYPTKEPEATFHAACVEGFFSSHIGAVDKFRGPYCNSIKKLPLSYKVCERYEKFSFKGLSLEEGDFYNFQLLEKFYDPYSKCPKAAFPS